MATSKATKTGGSAKTNGSANIGGSGSDGGGTAARATGKPRARSTAPSRAKPSTAPSTKQRTVSSAKPRNVRSTKPPSESPAKPRAARRTAQPRPASEPMMPLWEVFVRPRTGLGHQHVGSVHAGDREMALQAARDVYTRRGEGVSIWVVRSADITASDPGQSAENFEPAASKIYRHPSFYDIPDDVGHM